MTEKLFWKAEDAAAELGISAGAFRKQLLRSGRKTRATPGFRHQLYTRDDIEFARGLLASKQAKAEGKVG